MLRGTMMKTSGRVHGRIIIERPARYATTSHDGYSRV